MSTNLFSGTLQVTRRARTLALLLAATVASLVGLLLVTSEPAHAAINFTVNTAADDPDLSPGDNACDVSATAGDQCTLRAAIQEANTTTDADTINFRIGGNGPHTITPGSALPPITEALTINGYSESFGETTPAKENTATDGTTNAVLRIELSGATVGSSGDGLTIDASNVVVKGLVINRFSTGIFVNPGTSNKIEGNFIGTNASGTSSTNLGNTSDGVRVFSADNTVGGSLPAARNLISGNAGDGVDVGFDATGNKAEGNLIGTDASGTQDLGNGSDGVEIRGASNSVAVNAIAFNDGDGVQVQFNGGNRILNNSIHSNGGLGIDLDGGTQDTNGVTKNDGKDGDTGPNNLQNFPVLSSARTFSDGTTTIQGSLKSTPRKVFTVQFFSNPSGGDEGKKFLGELNVRTSRRGTASFEFITIEEVTAGEAVTATATRFGTKDTSEFSAAVPAS